MGVPWARGMKAACNRLSFLHAAPGLYRFAACLLGFLCRHSGPALRCRVAANQCFELASHYLGNSQARGECSSSCLLTTRFHFLLDRMVSSPIHTSTHISCLFSQCGIGPIHGPDHFIDFRYFEATFTVAYGHVATVVIRFGAKGAFCPVVSVNERQGRAVTRRCLTAGRRSVGHFPLWAGFRKGASLHLAKLN